VPLVNAHILGNLCEYSHKLYIAKTRFFKLHFVAYLQPIRRNCSKATEVDEIPQNNGHYVVQCHSRSPIFGRSSRPSESRIVVHQHIRRDTQNGRLCLLTACRQAYRTWHKFQSVETAHQQTLRYDINRPTVRLHANVRLWVMEFTLSRPKPCCTKLTCCPNPSHHASPAGLISRTQWCLTNLSCSSAYCFNFCHVSFLFPCRVSKQVSK